MASVHVRGAKRKKAGIIRNMICGRRSDASGCRSFLAVSDRVRASSVPSEEERAQEKKPGKSTVPKLSGVGRSCVRSVAFLYSRGSLAEGEPFPLVSGEKPFQQKGNEHDAFAA